MKLQDSDDSLISEELKKRRYYRKMYSSVDPAVAKVIDLLGSTKVIWISDDPWITEEAMLAMYFETSGG